MQSLKLELNPELHLKIFDCIPQSEHKSLYVVCKLWNALVHASHLDQKTLVRFVSKAIDKQIPMAEIHSVLHLASTAPDLMVSIKALSHVDLKDYGWSSHVLELEHFKTHLKLLSWRVSQIVHTEHFSLVWDPNSLMIHVGQKGKRKDFRTRFSIRFLKSSLQIEQANKRVGVASRVKFKDIIIDPNYEVGGRVFWKPRTQSEIVPLDMPTRIKGVLELSVRNYIDSLVRLNLMALSRFHGLQQFAQFTCFCNEDGLIVSQLKNTVAVCFKLIQIKQQDRTMEVLTWHSTSFITSHSLSDFLRWTVISSTVDEIAKKFRVQILKPHFGFSRDKEVSNLTSTFPSP